MAYYSMRAYVRLTASNHVRELNRMSQPFRVISLNVNGLRAATRKGLQPWLLAQNADVICLQEIRLSLDQVTEAMQLPGYHHHYVPAERKGYSGVAMYSRHQPTQVIERIGLELADSEGRFLQFDFDGVSVSSLYFPSGSHNEERQVQKYRFLDYYFDYMRSLLQQDQHHILCGDWNIAHKAIDLKNWRANQKNSGFLPQERAWMDRVIDELGFIDAFRQVNPHSDQYTWWSNRGRAWDNNVGWRIDYQIVSPALAQAAKAVAIYKNARFSDHAPLTIDYVI
jgi:exodeoxyribonuclease III